MKKEGWLKKRVVSIGLAFFVLLFLQIYSRVLLDRPDGVYATHPYVWADWSLHISMVNLFAHEPMSEWFRHHPVWSGGAFTYPFLSNLIPAMGIRLGLSLVDAMNFSTLLSAWVFLWGAFLLGRRLTGSGKVALAAISIFIFSSGHRGLGFWWSQFLAIFDGNWSWASFIHLPEDPSRLEHFNWLAGNVVEATILPQRAMTLGMALGVWALMLWYWGKDFAQSQEANPKTSGWNKSWIVSGVLIGFLPIAHMHTLITLAFVFPFLFWERVRIRDFTFIKNYIPGAALAIVFFAVFIHGKIQSQGFIGFDPFWTADGVFSWIALWWGIWGIFLPFAFFTEAVRLRAIGFRTAMGHESFLFSAGFFFLFVVANFVLFQPMHWDNSKLFFWCYFGLSFAVAALLKVFWVSSRIWVRAISVISFLILISTGSIEILRVVHYSNTTYQMTNRPLIDLGEKIQSTLHPREVFLTAPVHNHFVSMWATQPLFMGYSAWVMNYGFPWTERENELKTMLGGKMNLADFRAQARVNQIRYVCVGEDERRYLPTLNESFFASHFRVAFEGPGVAIYDVQNEIDLNGKGKLHD